MKLDTKEFRSSKKEIIQVYIKGGVDGVAEFCVLSAINLTAAFTFVAEYDTTNEEVAKKLETLKNFYGYTEVI